MWGEGGGTLPRIFKLSTSSLDYYVSTECLDLKMKNKLVSINDWYSILDS